MRRRRGLRSCHDPCATSAHPTSITTPPSASASCWSTPARPQAPEPRDVREIPARACSPIRASSSCRARCGCRSCTALILPFRPRRVGTQVPQDLVGRGLAAARALRAAAHRARRRRWRSACWRRSRSRSACCTASPESARRSSGCARRGAQRMLVLPLFPQYCGATTGAVYDQVNGELRRWRWLPELRFIAEYHDDPGYIDALRASVDRALAGARAHRAPADLLPRHPRALRSTGRSRTSASARRPRGCSPTS